jgi:2',3'-cyclic-nucleotide 2'-phosphodiesterase (5'-nucleotidase family)
MKDRRGEAKPPEQGARPRNIRLFFALLIVAVLHCAVFQARAAEKLTILHVNDFHGRVFPFAERSAGRVNQMGGAAYLAAMIEAQRARNPRGSVLLSAGDMFQGTPVSDLFQGKPVLEMMNALRFDAMTLGNHEFDWGRAALDGIIRSAAFPVLSANVVDRTTGACLGGVKPYIIVERKGVKIAVIGLTTPETAYATKAENVRGVAFLDPAGVLPGLLAETRQRGAGLIVLLTHLGLDEDIRLAASVSGIDVIVGGHSHTVVRDPVVVGQTIVVQAGCYGLYLGVLELTVDEKTGRIEAATKKAELKPVSAGPQDRFDARIARIAEGYGEKINDVFRQVVGETRVALTRRDGGESLLGDVVADAMRTSADAEIAIQNSGGIRADIPPGRITMEQVYMALPFDDLLVSMDLAGSTLVDLLEKSIAGNRGVLQVSGIHVSYDAAGKRVAGARVAGAALDRSRMYRVVTNDFLATGGDRFGDFRKGRNISYGGPVRDAFISYLKKHSPLAPRIEGRITITGG